MTLVASLLLLSACKRYPLYTPTAHVWPETVGYSGSFSVRAYGTSLMSFRFMGAVPGPDGAWLIRLDPALSVAAHVQATVVARTGDVLPLGPIPSVDVRFVSITPAQLVLKATGIHTLQEQN